MMRLLPTAISNIAPATDSSAVPFCNFEKMSYYQTPELYQQLLCHTELLEKVYAVMKAEDMSDLALTALDVLKTTKILPTFNRQHKSESVSNDFRAEGNKAFANSKFKLSLECYNRALLYAQPGSKPMLLAYSNRSALLNKTKNYTACLHDIETCLRKFICPGDVLVKLRKRKQDCELHMWKEQTDSSKFSQEYFKFNVKRHPDIPCVSTDVEIIFDPVTNAPKIVAANDIKTGTVVGVEPAFTSIINPGNHYISCYYCNKINLNLIPCDVCCFALFCNESCKQKCMDESHRLECHLMEVLNSNVIGPYSRITLRTVLKIKLLCNTWKEFSDASHCIGKERLEESTVNEIFDVKQKFSMLCFLNLRDIKPGLLYNFSFLCGTLLQQLINVPFFLPLTGTERDEAIRSVARMLMKLFLLFTSKIEMEIVIKDWLSQELKHFAANYGYFSFASKLNHCCNANLLPVGLNNKLGLVALQPIKKGHELTISYVEHAYDHMYEPEMTRFKRVVELYRMSRVCRCRTCNGTWKFDTRKLTIEQKKFFKKWLSSMSGRHDFKIGGEGEEDFKQTCAGLALMHGMAHTSEHRLVYAKFRHYMTIYQHLTTMNTCPDDK